MNRVFFGSEGLRTGWRVCIFFFAFGIGGIALFAFFHALAPQHFRASELTPVAAMVGEGSQCILVLAITAVFAMVEKRNWRDYGLPWRKAFGTNFWLGAVLGFLCISLELLITWALRGFDISGFAITAADGVRFGVEWAASFLLVAGFEESLFRGYPLHTLARGMRFWPAAVLTSLLFGAVHLTNRGEALFGALQAGIAGFLFCYMVYRTGSLWFPIGFHAAWDWGETYFYGVPDSGLIAKGHLLNTTLHGPWWISGGSVGPEGSLITTAIFAVAAFATAACFKPAESRYLPSTDNLPLQQSQTLSRDISSGPPQDQTQSGLPPEF